MLAHACDINARGDGGVENSSPVNVRGATQRGSDLGDVIECGLVVAGAPAEVGCVFNAHQRTVGVVTARTFRLSNGRTNLLGCHQTALAVHQSDGGTAKRSITTAFVAVDVGVLMAYTVERMNTGEEAATASTPLIGLTAITLGFIGAAWLSNRGRTTDAWRLLTLGAVAVALLMLPDLATSWNTLLAEEAAPSSEETPWDPSWPDEWLGTQIVVFDLPDQTVAVGGLVGHETVWALTMAAADERDLSLETEATGIGLYLVAINGVEATGWEYTINDQRGVLAMDEAEIETTLVLRWHLA